MFAGGFCSGGYLESSQKDIIWLIKTKGKFLGLFPELQPLFSGIKEEGLLAVISSYCQVVQKPKQQLAGLCDGGCGADAEVSVKNQHCWPRSQWPRPCALLRACRTRGSGVLLGVGRAANACTDMLLTHVLLNTCET